MAYSNESRISYSDSPSIDAFGRLRVGLPTNIYDSKQLHDNQPLLWDEAATGGASSSSHSTANAASTMTVSANGHSVIRQTFQRFNYQPGRSQLFMMTGILGSGVASVKRRIGCFDANNGLFFELDGTTLNVVKRKGASDTPVAQSSWNIDVFDGSGVSGVNLNTSKAQIFLIDFEWLGVGRVRMGFVVDGIIYYCHEFNHANSSTSVYMSTPNLPLRYEITSTGGTGTLVHICSSVISEAGSNPYIGIPFSESTGTTEIAADTGGTTYAAIGLKLKSTHLDAVIIPTSVSLICTTTDYFRWSLRMDPTISGTFTYSDITNSALQSATSTGAATMSSDSGKTLFSGFGSSQIGETSQFFTTSILRIGSSISGTPQALVLAVTPLGSGAVNADIFAAINWIEL